MRQKKLFFSLHGAKNGGRRLNWNNYGTTCIESQLK